MATIGKAWQWRECRATTWTPQDKAPVPRCAACDEHITEDELDWCTCCNRAAHNVCILECPHGCGRPVCPDCEIDHEHGDCPTAPAPEATAAMEKKRLQGGGGTGKGKKGEGQGTLNSARCPTAPTLNDWLNAGDAATASPA